MTIYDESAELVPRRRNNLTEADLLKIKEIFNETHPCTHFTDEQVHTVKEAIELLTPENIQAFKDILEMFRGYKKTVSGTIKIGFLIFILFIFWLAYKTGFLGAKILKF